MIPIKARVTPASAKEVLAEVGLLRSATHETLIDTITELTTETHRIAVSGIQRGPSTGRLYQKSNPRRQHQASAPGEYPQSDTGRLASSVRLELPDPQDKTPVGQVYTNLRYGLYLEMKAPYAGGRPWLLRSFNEATIRVTELLRERMGRRR